MFKCLIGDEYLINKEVQKIREEVGTDNCIFHTSAESVLDTIASPIIFSDKRAVVYKGSLEDLDNSLFWDFIKSEEPDNYLLVIPTATNSKSFKKLKSNGYVTEVSKLGERELSQYILSKVSFESNEAFLLYMNKAAFGQDGGKNLYEIESEVELLSALQRPVTIQDINNFIEESNYNNVFNLVNLIESKQTAQLLHSIDKILVSSNSSNALSILGLIRREYRMSYKQYTLGATKSEIGNNYIRKHSNSEKKIELINRYSNFIVEGRMLGSQALKLCIFELLDLVK